MTLRALLIDVDGTLADTEGNGHRPAYNEAFRELGLGFRWNAELYRELLLQPSGRERLMFYLKHHRPELGPHAASICSDMQGFVERVHRLKSHYYQQLMSKGRIPLRPGMARLIREAHAAGITIALVSNSSQASLNAMIEHGLGPRLAANIDLIIGGDGLRHRKPAPEPYLLALSRLGLSANECVALEDSAMGLKAACAAGIPTVITCNSNTEDEDFQTAALVLESLGEPRQAAKVRRGKLMGDYLTLADLQRLCVERGLAA